MGHIYFCAWEAERLQHHRSRVCMVATVRQLYLACCSSVGVQHVGVSHMGV